MLAELESLEGKYLTGCASLPVAKAKSLSLCLCIYLLLLFISILFVNLVFS